jgi:hypothetical protein
VRRRIELAGINYTFSGDFDSMVPELSLATRWRAKARRAWSSVKVRMASAQ